MSTLETLLEQTAERWTPQQARRLLHGRGHCFPGLEHWVINWFPPYLQIAHFGARETLREDEPSQRDEVEVEFSIDQLLQGLLQQAHDKLGADAVAGVVLQRRDGRATRSEVIFGEVPDECVTWEHDLQYWIQPQRNQNVGLFMDMSHVRHVLAPAMAGARVLNLFAYTCAFSVSAIAHGAELVVNNDMSRNALDLGARNHELNGHDLRRVRMLPHNLFKSWWKLRQFGPYDVIIIDPPTNQRGSFVAEKSYGQVLKRLPELAAPDATVLACLNSPFLDSDWLQGQVARWAPSCEFELRHPPHPDFPDQFPERALKVLQYRYKN